MNSPLGRSILLIAVCGGTLANGLIISPIAFDYLMPYGDIVRDYFGITLLMNLSANSWVIPRLIETAVHFTMIAGLISGINGVRSALRR